jgi:hypothetical protein
MIRDKAHGETCPYCHRTMDKRNFHLQPTRDHVIPRCRGGTVKIICCLKCNGIKSDMLPDAWAAYMAANPGWWLLTKAERKARRRAARRVYGMPDGRGNVIRKPQGTPPAALPIVPPEFIWMTL